MPKQLIPYLYPYNTFPRVKQDLQNSVRPNVTPNVLPDVGFYRKPYIPKPNPNWGYKKYTAFQKDFSEVANYNDPFELNSIADIILTTGQTGKNTKYKTQFKEGLLGAPIVNILPRFGEYFNKYTLQPALKGDFGTVSKNTLVGGMETLDILANPVKAFFQGENPLDALGWGTQGRKNYDWDTGNLVTDIVMETLSDPMTYVGGVGLWKQSLKWTSLGAKGGAKGVANVVMDALGEAGEAWIKEIGPEAAEKYLKKVIKRGMTLVINGEADNVLSGLSKAATKAAEGGHTVRKFMNIDFPEAVVKGLKEISESNVDEASMRILDSTVGSMNRQLKAIKRFEQVDDTITGLGFFGASGLSGVYYGFKTNSAVMNYVDRSIDRKLAPFIKEKGILSFTEYEKLLEVHNGKVSSLNKAFARYHGLELKGKGLTNLLKRNAGVDLIEIRKVINSDKHDPAGLLRAIEDQLEFRHGTTLDGYIETVRNINTQTENSFLDVEEEFVKIKNIYDLAKETISGEARIAKLEDTIDSLSVATHKLDRIERRFIGGKTLMSNEEDVLRELSLDEELDGVLNSAVGPVVAHRVELKNTLKTGDVSNSTVIDMAVKRSVNTRLKKFADKFTDKITSLKTTKAEKELAITLAKARKELTASKKFLTQSYTKKYTEAYTRLYDTLMQQLIKIGYYDPDLHQSGKYIQLIDDYASAHLDEFINTERIKIDIPEFNKYLTKWREDLKLVHLGTHEIKKIKSNLQDQQYFIDLKLVGDQLQTQSEITNYNTAYNNLLDTLARYVQETTIRHRELPEDMKYIFHTMTKERAKSLQEPLTQMSDIVMNKIKSTTKLKPIVNRDALKLSINTINSIDSSGLYFQGYIMDAIQKFQKNKFKGVDWDWDSLEKDYTEINESVMELFGNMNSSTNVYSLDTISVEHWFNVNIDKKSLNMTPEVLMESIESFQSAKMYYVNEDGKRVMHTETFMSAYNDLYHKLQALDYNMLDGGDHESVQAIMRKMDEFDIAQYKRISVNATMDEIWYIAKLEQAYNSMLFLRSDSEVGSALEDIYTNQQTGLGKLIHRFSKLNLADPTIPEAQRELAKLGKQVLMKVKGITDYRLFVHDIMTSPVLDEPTRTAFLSVIQNYSRSTLKSMDDKSEHIIKKVIDKLETYNQSRGKDRSYKLDDFRNNPKNRFWETTGLDPNAAHRSDADNITTKWLLENELKMTAGPNDFFFDGEFTGLDYSKHNFLEGTFTKGDASDSIKYKVDLDTANIDAPQNSVLRIWDPTGYKSDVELKEMYNKHYSQTRNTDKDVANTVAWCKDEQEAVDNLFDFLEKNYVLGANLIIQNGENFDKPFIRALGIKYGKDPAILDQWGVIDTLKELKKKDGVYSMSMDEKDTLRQILDKYLRMRYLNGKGSLKFIDSINTSLIDDFRAMADMFRNSDVLKSNNDIVEGQYTSMRMSKEELNEIRKSMWNQGVNSGGYAEPTEIKEAQELAQNMVIALKEQIKTVNKSLESFAFSNKTLEDPEFHKVLKETLLEAFTTSDNDKLMQLKTDLIKAGKDHRGVKERILEAAEVRARAKEVALDNLKKAYPESFSNKAFTPKQALEDALDKWVDVTNTSKIFYGLTEGLNLYGIKTIGNFQNINNWFVIPVGSELDTVVSAQLQKFTNKFASKYNGIRNVAPLRPLEGGIDELLKLFKEADATETHSVFKHLRTEDNDVVSKYVIAEYLRSWFRTKAIGSKKTDFLTTKLGILRNTDKDRYDSISNVLEFMNEDSLIIRHPEIPTKGMTFVEYTDKKLTDANLNGFDEIYEMLKGEAEQKEFLDIKLNPIRHMVNAFKSWFEGVGYNTRTKMYNNLNDAQDIIKTQYVLPQVLAMAEDPVKLRNWLAHNGTYATYSTKEFKRHNNLTQLTDKLLQKTNELKQVGIDVILSETDERIYIRLNKTIAGNLRVDFDDLTRTKKLYLNDAEIPRVQIQEVNLEQVFKDTNLWDTPGFDTVYKAILDTRKNLHSVTNGSSIGSTMDIMTPDILKNLYQNIPEEIKKDMYDLELLTSGSYFSDTMHNFINLGSLAHQKEIQEFLPKSMISSMLTATKVSTQHLVYLSRYTEDMFHGIARIDLGEWADAKYNQNWLDTLRDNPAWCFAALVADPKAERGYRMKMLTIKTLEDVENAKRLKAVYVTKQRFGKVSSMLNESVFDTGFLRLWSNIMRVYKAGYLFNPGVWMRNYLDSTIKTMVATETFGETFKAQHAARAMIKNYDKHLDEILYVGRIDIKKLQTLAKEHEVTVADILEDVKFKAANLQKETASGVIDAVVLQNRYNTAMEDIINMDANKLLNMDNINFYFEHMTQNFDKESFMFVYEYLTKAPSAGPTKVLQKYYDTLSKAGRSSENMMGVEHAINSIMDLAMSPNQNVEQIVRLAQHIIQTKQGLSFTESAYRLAKTHFDYSLKTDVNRLIELIIPFYTFKMRNMEFWLDAAMEHPWLLRTLSNIYTPVFDLDSYDHYEYANNKSLEYQILSGNIPLSAEGMTLKVNPSSMDTFNMLVDPVGTFKSSMFGPFQTLIDQMLERRLMATGGEVNQNDAMSFLNNAIGISDYTASNVNYKDEWLKQLPVVGTAIQKYQQAQTYYGRTGNLLNALAPDWFGATKRYAPYTPYTPKTYVRKGYVKAQKARRIYGNKSYYKRAYPKNYKGAARPVNYANYKLFKEWDYKPYDRPRYVRDTYTNWWHRPKAVKHVNIYEKYYTRKGKRRMDTMLEATTPKNLMWKIRTMFHYMK